MRSAQDAMVHEPQDPSPSTSTTTSLDETGAKPPEERVTSHSDEPATTFTPSSLEASKTTKAVQPAATSTATTTSHADTAPLSAENSVVSLPPLVLAPISDSAAAPLSPFHEEDATTLPRLLFGTSIPLARPQSAQPFRQPTPRTYTAVDARPMMTQQFSLNVLHSKGSRLATTSDVDPIINVPNVAPTTPRQKSQSMVSQHTLSPRRSLQSVEISHHALERLGVDLDIVKKEKGMKKLGISDVDIERSVEIRRYSGLPMKAPDATVSKAELIFGFTTEQLQREKAINRLGTTEQEILDDYSKRLSMLGMPQDRQVISPGIK